MYSTRLLFIYWMCILTIKDVDSEQKLFVMEQHDIQIVCNKPPNNEVYWEKASARIEDNMTSHFLIVTEKSKSILNVLFAKKEFQGLYYCIDEATGQILHRTFLIVTPAHQSFFKSYDVGYEIILTCVESIQNTVVWHKDSSDEILENSPYRTRSYAYESRLEFTADPSLSGTYTCKDSTNSFIKMYFYIDIQRTSNGIQQTRYADDDNTQEAFLSIKVPSKNIETVAVEFGDYLNMSCSKENLPLEAKINWQFNKNFILPFEEKADAEQLLWLEDKYMENILHIAHLTQSNTGLYECLYFHDGQLNYISSFTLIYKGCPLEKVYKVFIAEPAQQDITVGLLNETTFSFTCQTPGEYSKLLWLYNEIPIDENAILTNAVPKSKTLTGEYESRLYIYNMSESHTGHYKCVYKTVDKKIIYNTSYIFFASYLWKMNYNTEIIKIGDGRLAPEEPSDFHFRVPEGKKTNMYLNTVASNIYLDCSKWTKTSKIDWYFITVNEVESVATSFASYYNRGLIWISEGDDSVTLYLENTTLSQTGLYICIEEHNRMKYANGAYIVVIKDNQSLYEVPIAAVPYAFKEWYTTHARYGNYDGFGFPTEFQNTGPRTEQETGMASSLDLVNAFLSRNNQRN